MSITGRKKFLSALCGSMVALGWAFLRIVPEVETVIPGILVGFGVFWSLATARTKPPVGVMLAFTGLSLCVLLIVVARNGFDFRLFAYCTGGLLLLAAKGMYLSLPPNDFQESVDD